MAKNSKEQIEKDEKKIISILQKDGRASFDSIAKECGFSRQKVWKIVNRLEKDKTITGYKAFVDNKKLGLKRFLILVSVNGTLNLLGDDNQFGIFDAVVRGIESLGVTINGSSLTHGRYDWILDVTTDKDINVIKKCEQMIYKLTHSYLIKDTDILQVLLEHPVTSL